MLVRFYHCPYSKLKEELNYESPLDLSQSEEGKKETAKFDGDGKLDKENSFFL